MKNQNNIFDEINLHLLNDKKPSDFLNNLNNEVLSNHPFNMLLKLKFTNQSHEHHPEGNVWNHTVMVVDEAVKVKDKSSDSRVFLWAALLHDIGKPDTTRVRKSKITAYNHDKVGAEMSKEFLKAFVNDNDFILNVTALVRWHMQILFVVNDLPFAEIEAMKKEVTINDISLLGLCDRLGRANADRKKELGSAEKD